MGAGLNGTYVLTSRQTSIDGAINTNCVVPRAGQVWSWQGEPTRLDGPQSTLVLSNSVEEIRLKERISNAIARRAQASGIPFDTKPPSEFEDGMGGFILSDGVDRYRMVEVVSRGETLLWCAAGLPRPGCIYTVIHSADQATLQPADEGDVICFVQGTRIKTLGGEQLIEHLEPGDLIQTKDNGPKKLLWVGKRPMPDARLAAFRDERPVCIRAQAFGLGGLETDLLVSPQHRVLLSGDWAQALFNQSEVLVAARDLINDRTVFVDHAASEITYYHLLFENHEILWANGVEAESFHPANTSLMSVMPNDRDVLLALYPDLEIDPHSYGPFARRNLDRAEAAILLQSAR
ncbi:Hint domain-containing protein [Litoreibacter roseus]|uniref:Hedgehog/Intein (Hint) domain-containing protein n=1 Tax=Litoreibacter roseus TaxID=2601869 RepID=A0A6N6JGG7_9RHOB|nr:Hint domain-containing protein [Litoreibacter roseus]GFE65326.1 hypothetical protein KIN_24000 [Litoreibacter roseus]